ncbi:hypothetical protein [Streptomyces sp. bgisy153]|uniref:hypothetical protein n=1 Tax=Streptomyces sp. bgisy153 TaxID=3413793 RepID=UPI003D72D02C
MSVSTNLLSANVESVETDVSGWTAGANTSLFQSTRYYTGTKSLGMTATAAGSVTATTATRVAVTVGEEYQGYAFFAGITAVADRTTYVTVDWWADAAGGTPIASSTGAATTMANSTSWNTPPPQVTAVAPEGAQYASLTVTVTGLPAGGQVAGDLFKLGLPSNSSLNLYPYTATSVETDATEWTGLTNTSVGRLAMVSREGWYSLSLTSVAAGPMDVVGVPIASSPGTELMGQVSARSAAGPIRVDLRWYDASDALIATTTGIDWALTDSDWTTCQVVGTAPAGTAFVRLALCPTATDAGQLWTCDLMRIFDCATVGAAGNLLTYAVSEFEGGLSDWQVSGATASLSSDYYYGGSYSMKVVATGGDVIISLETTPTQPIVPGQSYQMRVPVRMPTVTPALRTRIEWLDSTGSALRTRWQSWTSEGASGWVWGPMGDIAPDGAESIRISLEYSDLTAGDTLYVDRAQFLVGGLTVSAVPAGGGGALITMNGLSSRDPSWLWTLVRLDAAGTSYPVRGWSGDLTSQTITGDVAAVTDYETPLGVPMQWRVSVKNPSGSGYQDYLSDPLTLDSSPTEVWLKDPGLPQKNVRLVVQPPVPTWTRSARQGVAVVRGRSLPVVISDVRGGRVGDLTVVTETDADRRALDWVLDAGGPLLLQWPPGWGEDDMFVSIGDVTAAPVADFAEFHDRTWVLPLTQVDRPIGGVTGDADRTWQTVKDGGATWADVLDGVTSWLTIRIGA